MAAIIKYDNYTFDSSAGVTEPYVSVTEEEILGTLNTGQLMMSKTIDLEGFITGNDTQEIYTNRYKIK